MARSNLWAFLLLLAPAMLFHGQSFARGQAAQRWPPRMPGSPQGVGPHPTGDDVAARGKQHGQESLFPIFSTEGDVAVVFSSSLGRNPVFVPFTGHEEAPLSLTSGLSMLSIVAAELGLRATFRHLGWSFPSSVAGVIILSAGAESLMGLLEPGSTQIMAWLPLMFVPVLIPWGGPPLTTLMASFKSLPEAVVSLAKLGAIGRNFYPAAESARAALRGARARGSKLRAAVNVMKLLLTASGGWLVNFVAATALFTALSPTSSSAASSSAFSITRATASAAGSLSPKTSGAAKAAVGFSRWRLVRRLGTGMFASGVVCVVLLRTYFYMLMGTSRSIYDIRDLLGTIYLVFPGSCAGLLTLGLAAMTGFAAGRTGLSSWGLFGHPCSPWTAMLLPVAPSVAATFAAAATLHRTTCRLCSFYLVELFGPKSMLWMWGRTDLVSRFLGPAVLSFAPPLFRMRGLIFSNAMLVVEGSIACASTALFGIALGSRLLGVPKAFNTFLHAKSPTVNTSVIFKLSDALRSMSPWRKRKNLPSKAVTVVSALGFSAPSMIAGVLVLTGVLGATVGARILDALGVKDPMTRGLIQGGTLDVFGVASSYRESAGEGPTPSTATDTTLARDVSTATMILTGVAGTVLVNIPAIRSLLLSIALGSRTAGSVVPLPNDAFELREYM